MNPREVAQTVTSTGLPITQEFKEIATHNFALLVIRAEAVFKLAAAVATSSSTLHR
jgi:hypothetical protein